MSKSLKVIAENVNAEVVGIVADVSSKQLQFTVRLTSPTGAALGQHEVRILPHAQPATAETDAIESWDQIQSSSVAAQKALAAIRDLAYELMGKSKLFDVVDTPDT